MASTGRRVTSGDELKYGNELPGLQERGISTPIVPWLPAGTLRLTPPRPALIMGSANHTTNRIRVVTEQYVQDAVTLRALQTFF